MPQPKAVIFDIGNVLIEWNPERYFDRVIGQAQRERMFAEVDIHGMMERIDAGASFAETVAETAQGNSKWHDAILHIRDCWTDVASPAIDRSVRLMRALKKNKVPVFALTNFGVQNFPLSEAKFPFLGEFDRRYISGELGLIKPDPQIYAVVEADTGLAPESLLFTDDREDNIATAHARGWQAHLFDGPDGWARALVSYGLLSAAEAGI